MKHKHKKVGKLNFEVRTKIFERPVHIFLNYEHSEFAALMRKRGIPYDDDPNYGNNFAAFSTSWMLPNKPMEWAICIRAFDWTIRHQVDLIQEIVHTIIKTWHLNNVPMDEHTQEFAATEIGELYGIICRQIFDHINKPKRKKK